MTSLHVNNGTATDAERNPFRRVGPYLELRTPIGGHVYMPADPPPAILPAAPPMAMSSCTLAFAGAIAPIPFASQQVARWIREALVAHDTLDMGDGASIGGGA